MSWFQQMMPQPKYSRDQLWKRHSRLGQPRVRRLEEISTPRKISRGVCSFFSLSPESSKVPGISRRRCPRLLARSFCSRFVNGKADSPILGMIEAGFVDVVEEQRLIPINSWPVTREDKLIGSWQSLNFLKLAGGLGKMLQAAGFPQEDLPKFQEQFRHDVTWAQMRVYFPGR